MTNKLTHKGWFGICPVYFADLETDAPLVVERHWIFVPLMLLSEAIFYLAFTAWGMIDPDFEPQWPLKITGKLE